MLALLSSLQNSCAWDHGNQRFVFLCPVSAQCAVLDVGLAVRASSCLVFPASS